MTTRSTKMYATSPMTSNRPPLTKACSVDMVGAAPKSHTWAAIPHRAEPCISLQPSLDQEPTHGRKLVKADSKSQIDTRAVFREVEKGIWPEQGITSKVHPSVGAEKRKTAGRQALRKTLSDNISISRWDDVTVQDLTLEETGDSHKYQKGGSVAKTMSQPDSFSSSCPNLIQGTRPVSRAKPPALSISDGKEPSGHSLPLRSPGSETVTQQKLLTVPNIFVTSFTHSSPQPHRSIATSHHTSQSSASSDMRTSPALPSTTTGGPRSSYRHSAPELSATSLAPSHWDRLRESLRPSLYKTPSIHNQDATGSGTCERPAARNQRVVNEARMAKVLSYLYIGNLETSYNERLTCRLGIRSIIDLSNLPPEEVPPARRNHVPCMCMREECHLKATLRLGLADMDISEMEASFRQINKFIEGARKVEKKVLVVCLTGNSVSALAVMQYLMVHRGCNLRKAHSMVMRQGADIELSPRHQLLLQTLEKRLLPVDQQSLCFDRGRRDSLGVPCRATYLTREAWTTESDL